MATFHPVCPLSDLKDATTLGFSVMQLEGFVVYKAPNVYAYKNSCPHIGMNLEFTKDKFLDAELNYIQCSMHGALFEIENGLCVHGPCLNQSLTALPAKIEDEQVWVELTDHFDPNR
jgi:nitrite reductase/ring-hydroxylating ferredoxin subunit